MATADEKAVLAAAEVEKARKFERSVKFMKKAVLEVQLILLDGVDTDAQLHAAGRILAQSEYDDVVEERYIAKVCGYARCGNTLSAENARKGRYRISLSAKKVYDLEESRRFCSPACLVSSKDFGSKLPVQKDVVESSESLIEILAAVRGSQYVTRSKPVRLKEDNVLKPPARPKNVKRGKVRPKQTKSAPSANSDVTRSPVEDAGLLDSGVMSAELSIAATESVSENENHEDVSSSSSGLDTKGSLIKPQVEQSCSTGTNPSSQITPVVSSTSGSDRKAAGTATKNSLSVQRLWPDKDSLSPLSNSVQTKFEKLTIQEHVGDQTVLPVFDYGGPSNAIEGYVPSRSRRDAHSQAQPRTRPKASKSVALRSDEQQRSDISSKMKAAGEETTTVLSEEVQRSEQSSRSQHDEARIFKEWEGLVSESSQATACIAEVDGETIFSDAVPEFSAGDSAPSTRRDVQGKSSNLKPALKKETKAKRNARSVAWADQETSTASPHCGKTKWNEIASSTSADKRPIFKSSDDVTGVEENMNSIKLEEEGRPEARLSESSLDVAMAARLASADAVIAALTEAATSSANGELDGSEAVIQAGISILPATHNASSVKSVSSLEAQVQSCALDDDELFAKAAQAREGMRRLKMPRKYSELQDEDGNDDSDPIGGINQVVSEDDHGSDGDDDVVDDADVDDDDDDGYDDDNGGFEGAHEVGFTAPPKGFKAEVSMFGTIFMALEGWISAAAVAHIYGKEPREENEYLSVNGREYSPQATFGDGVSTEISRTFSLCVSRALPEVVRALRISVPLSTLELSLGRLIRTMSFVEALPPFGTKQWRVLAILLLDALSIQRVPRLGASFSNSRSMMRKVLDSTKTSEAEYDVFRDVVLPLGRSATFSTLSGG